MGRHILQLPVRHPETMRTSRDRLHRLRRMMGEYVERYISLRIQHADRDERFMRIGYVVWLVGISLAALVELVFLAVIMWDMIH